jgi:LTXXQ motif family protein
MLIQVEEEVRLRKLAIVGAAALAIAGSTAVYAQYRPWIREHMQHMKFTAEDRAAFTDARIAAIHAGLKLTPDQEKLWPPVEAAVRDFAKMRIDRANARMKAADDQQNDQPKEIDPMTRLRQRADNMAATATALKKIADAADPLYKTLDEGQKRRLSVLTHGGRLAEGGGGWKHRWMERGMGRGERDGRDGRDGRGGERL